jgi:hypothetical protein
LPSGIRGGGAAMFGWPSGVFGTFGVGNDGHCAISGSDAAATAATSTDTNLLMQSLQRDEQKC